MTYPIPNYSRVWVRGRIIDLGKAVTEQSSYGVSGSVTFTPSAKVLINAGTQQIIASTPFRVAVGATNGYFAIQLPATDDPDVNPTNFTYNVSEPTGRSYNILVPQDTPLLNKPGDPLHGQPVIELSDVVPAPGPSAGLVQLARGRGLDSITVESGNWVAHYDDDTTQIIGPAPTGGGSSYTDEQVRDVIAAALRGGTGVTITNDDAGDTITIAATGLQVNTTGAAVGGLYALRQISEGEYESEAAVPAADFAALTPAVLRPVIRPSRGAQTMLTTFAPGHGWTGNGVGTINLNDTSDYALGSQCLSVVTSGGGNSGGQRSEITRSAIPAFDMTGKSLRLWVKLVSSTRLDRVRIGVGTDASNYYLIDAAFPAAHASGITPDGEWAVVDFDLAGASAIGTPTRTACTWLMVRVTDIGAAQSATVRVGGIALVDKPPASRYPNGVITLGFDDGYVDQFTNARAKMDEYGFAATCYIIQDLIGPTPSAYMSAAQLRQLEDLSGWEVAAHAATTVNHNVANAFASLTENQLRTELETHKKWMIKQGFRGVDHFAYPQGKWSAQTVPIVREYFATARTTTPPGYGSATPAESQRMRVYPINAGTSAAVLNGMVDQVKANRSWLQLYTHRVLPSGAVGTQIEKATFDAMVDYIAAQGVAVRTVGDVLAGV